MRLTLTVDNPKRECQGCDLQDEKLVSAYILSFQVAEQFLTRYTGTWELGENELKVNLPGLENPLIFDLENGNVSYGTVHASLTTRYVPHKGMVKLVEDLIGDFALPNRESKNHYEALFAIFVKLIEIFHARCGLKIKLRNKENPAEGYIMYLYEGGPSGTISKKGIIENRYGEKFDINIWCGLRPEKIATYIFGFNKFCHNYLSPYRIH